ncbi:hypothetical protein NQ318_016454 [Aromia moschata]|uniref:Transposase n=1 Tax=Aromia moschata TaxID=1265417 RepID=A0AAV8Z3J1_9CUCU|nr:hypothetical protein NQ318_016454 [Aromia moschata]
MTNCIPREQFCLLFLDRHNDDPNFLNKVMFTDETTFTRLGVFNFVNKHVCDNENPHIRIIPLRVDRFRTARAVHAGRAQVSQDRASTIGPARFMAVTEPRFESIEFLYLGYFKIKCLQCPYKHRG